MSELGIAPYRAALQSVQYQPVAVVPQKPSIWEQYRSLLAPPVESVGGLHSAVVGLRHNLESAALGALLGAIYGKFGTLDVKGVPVDGIAAAAFYALSIREAGKPDGFASDLRAMSQSCMSVLAFRKTANWVGQSDNEDANLLSSGMSGHKDPLIAAAQKHGL